MKSVPLEERPREKLMREGTAALSLTELLAIVLGSGTQGKSVLELAAEVVTHFGGLDALLGASVAELQEIRGIGPAKAVQLKAVLGIASRCRQGSCSSKVPLKNAEQVYRIAREEIGSILQEALFVLLRDVRGCLLHYETVAIGTLSQVLAHPREVFYPAIRHKAASLIIAHNHPSGDPTPSHSDFELTRGLIEASRILAIRLDDHLIVCKERFLSLREEGCFPHLKGRY